ncbi:MAG TPA: hypothetical protein EYP56_14125, partial [Planctomycetaceae bacterium]|nr:hypothetical protein [Planctomycetaceae bacterium]
PAEKRPEHFWHRGDKDYLVFKPLAETLDDAIELYETRAYEKYLEGSRPVTHYTPHMLQLLEFQEKMDRQVPIIVGAASPTNYAETIVEVQRFVRWTITEPEEKVRHYLQLVLDERLAALEFFKEYAAGNGCEFFAIFGGARTWGPKQLEQFGEYDRKFFEKTREIFPYVFWHHCGHNLPESLEAFTRMDGLRGVQYDMPYYSQRMTWPEFYEWVAKMFAGKLCAMNSPTTQVCCYGTEEEVRTMVRQFIQATLPHTTAVIMPGCEIDSYAPAENVKAMIDEARSKRYHEWLS